MIVCWVLFGVAVIASGLSYNVFSVTLPLKGPVENVFSAFDDPSIPVEQQTARADEIQATNVKREKLQQRKRIAGELVFYSSVGALGLMLWNLILHTGHWIWIGRKPK